MHVRRFTVRRPHDDMGQDDIVLGVQVGSIESAARLVGRATIPTLETGVHGKSVALIHGLYGNTLRPSV